MKTTPVIALLAALAAPACTSALPADPAHPEEPAAQPFAVAVTGQGPAMILIPGLASSGDVWKTTVEHEKDHFTCHVLTLAGFAGQPRAGGPLIPQVREAIAAYIAREKLGRPVVVGHSLGAVIALDLAARHPDEVGPLVLVDGLPFLPAAFDPGATAESARAGAEAMRTQMTFASTEAFRMQEQAALRAMITDPAAQRVALDWAMRSDREAVAGAMVEVMTTDLRPALGKIASPALVVGTWAGWPGGDRAETARGFARQYAGLRGARIVMADRSRHFVMLDDPAFLFAQMDAFLGEAGVYPRTASR
jgi:pimeloyl-ACP methyl ester carboxylesterase